VTQMIFDADVYVTFLSDCRAIGINVPILPGIMCVQVTMLAPCLASLLFVRLPPHAFISHNGVLGHQRCPCCHPLGLPQTCLMLAISSAPPAGQEEYSEAFASAHFPFTLFVRFAIHFGFCLFILLLFCLCVACLLVCWNESYFVLMCVCLWPTGSLLFVFFGGVGRKRREDYGWRLRLSFTAGSRMCPPPHPNLLEY